MKFLDKAFNKFVTWFDLDEETEQQRESTSHHHSRRHHDVARGACARTHTRAHLN